MTNREQFFKWIQNAYVMEKQIETVLERHEKDAEEYPEYQDLIREHKELTANQAERLHDILVAHDEDIPFVKEGLSKAMGFLEAEVGELAHDQIIKNWVAEHTTEHFEMATYMVILEACRMFNEHDIETMIATILREEEDAAKKLNDIMPSILSQYVSTLESEED